MVKHGIYTEREWENLNISGRAGEIFAAETRVNRIIEFGSNTHPTEGASRVTRLVICECRNTRPAYMPTMMGD